MKQAALLALICLAVSPTWAVNKCTIGGQVVFQDTACPGKGESITVRPASGASPRDQVTTTADPAAAKPISEAQRIEAKVKSSQDARRKADLEARIVPNAEMDIERSLARCDREYRALEVKKGRANNNLAGATWEVSISSEMTALATRCDTKNRDLRAEADKLRAECQQLGGCK